jgi:hypothetical protein
MSIIRRAILTLALIAGISPAIAQVPPPVPALPDIERRTSYAITSSTCACAVGFQLYGDSTDYQNWVEIFINGIRVNYNDPTFGWTITSPTGPLGNIARPISNAVLTFASAQTGTIQIVGARRPRRTSQFSESQGVSARNLNQALTDIVAQNRETWDKTNDVTGRAVLGIPGETLSLLPPAATRAGKYFIWDAFGNPSIAAPGSGSGNVTGTSPTILGNAAVFSGIDGTVISDGGGPAALVFLSRATAAAASIPATVNAITVGGDTYIRLGSTPSPVQNWHFQSAGGVYWQLSTPVVYPRQVGALLDGVTDDTVAIQAWVDYGATFGVPSLGQPGTAIIPQTAINLPAGANVDGLNKLTLKKTTDVNVSIMDCDTNNNVVVKNTIFTTTAGFGSTSSNSLTASVQNYTVPAGLVGMVVGQFVQITAVSDPLQYGIAQINSYSGTTLNVTMNPAGAGTFSNWYIDRYPNNGAIAPVNMALRSKTCNQVRFEGNTVTGRFYDGIDSRDGSDIYFVRNSVSGSVNRALHQAAYNVAVTNNQMLNNKVSGNLFTQYCINWSGTDSGSMQQGLIDGNVVFDCIYQGIEAGGTVQYSTISNNQLKMPVNTAAVGIVLQKVPPTFVTQHITVNGNTVNGAFVGVDIIDSLFWGVSNNKISGSNICFLAVGTTAAANAYGTLTGNGATSCATNGFQFSANVANGAFGHSITGNTTIGSTGTGLLTEGNTGSFVITGNVSLSNGTQYTTNGTGHVLGNNK